MKKPLLVLLALLALLPFAQLMAQTPAAALPPAKSATAPVPDVAQFLATLSGGQAKAPNDLVPTPLFMTGCNTTGCQAGEICCFLCGNPPEGDDSGCWGCVTPVKPYGCPQVS